MFAVSCCHTTPALLTIDACARAAQARCEERASMAAARGTAEDMHGALMLVLRAMFRRRCFGFFATRQYLSLASHHTGRTTIIFMLRLPACSRPLFASQFSRPHHQHCHASRHPSSGRQVHSTRSRCKGHARKKVKAGHVEGRQGRRQEAVVSVGRAAKQELEAWEGRQHTQAMPPLKYPPSHGTEGKEGMLHEYPSKSLPSIQRRSRMGLQVKESGRAGVYNLGAGPGRWSHHAHGKWRILREQRRSFLPSSFTVIAVHVHARHFLFRYY